METNIVMCLLMLFGNFFEASESLAENGFGVRAKSSDRHLRKKRIIDTSHNRDEAVYRQEVPYVVLLVNNNRQFHCTGIILNPRIILTCAHCVYNQTIEVATGGRWDANTKFHKVVIKYIHQDYVPDQKISDLALLLINTPVDLFHRHHRAIQLYQGRLPPNSHGLVTGWGCITRETEELPSQPLSILVQILSLQQCQSSYRDITSHQICTHSVNRTKSCWKGDSGSPLVVGGHLVGVFCSFHPSTEQRFPDIFMNLLNPEYYRWVVEWTNDIKRHYRL